MNISFIIPAYNEAANISRCIKSIVHQMEKSSYEFEIIVSNHSSQDDTSLIASSLGAKVICVPRGGNVSEVRNLGAASASGKVFVFLDADIELTDDWFDNFSDVMKTLELNPYQLVGSICIPPDEDNYLIKHWFKKITIKNSGYLGTAHLITTKECFDSLGGFNKGLSTGEDYDFCQRCKSKNIPIIIAPALVVYHHDYPKKIADFVRREAWHGEGDFQTLSGIFKSKVALTALVFIFIHFILLLSLVFFIEYSFFLVIFMLFFVAALAFYKFPDVSIYEKIRLLPVLYLYFIGRSLSPLRVIQKNLNSR